MLGSMGKQGKNRGAAHPWHGLPAWDKRSGSLNVVIETVQGSRNKLKLDPKRGVFMLGSVLPAGSEFPYDFGFVPSTRGDDGDPLDVLVLMDEPVFVGCLVGARLIGVIEAQQTEAGETVRNDRLIAVAAGSHQHGDVQELGQISAALLDEIEHFFVSYNAIAGKRFNPLGRHGAERARGLLESGMAAYQKSE